MRDKIRVYIDGNGYGFGNIGDDAILQGILILLKELPSIGSITVAVKDGVTQPFIDRDIRITDSFNFNSAKREIARSDFLVIGGGTMIGDELGIQFPLAHAVERALSAEGQRKRTVLFGIGANEPGTEQGRKLARMLVNHSSLIMVRDSASLRVCQVMSHNPNSVFKTSDPAYLLEPMETERTKKMKTLIHSKGRTVGINVVNEVWSSHKLYKKAIAEACNRLFEKDAIVPVFISNEIRPGVFFDHEANRETASYLNCEHLVLEPVYFTPEEMIDVISAFDLFLSMRMHGLIFAALANVPFTTISRIDKVENFMNQFGRTSFGTIDSVTPEQVYQDLVYLEKNRDKAIEDLKRVVLENRTECKKNVMYFNEYLNKDSEKSIVLDRMRLLLDRIKFHILTRS